MAMKQEGNTETCCVCGCGEELVSPEEYDAAAPPSSPPLRALLSRLAGGAVPEGRLCASCLQRALDAHELSTALRARAPPPLSEKVRLLRRRLAELTENIDVFIVVGGGGQAGGEAGSYGEDDIIMVERGALLAAAEHAHARNARGDSVYQCSVCPLSFLTAGEYRSHLASHPSEAVHSCWTCGSQFPSRAALHQHTTDEHPIAQTTCYICNTNFQSQTELSRHCALCRAVCPACSLPLPDRESLSLHCRQRHAGPGGPLLCPRCFRCLPTREALTAHVLTHRHQHHYVCGYGDCVLRFPNRSNLLAHIRKCHAPDVNPLTCQQCNRTFATTAALRRHERVHTKMEQTTEVVVETEYADGDGEGEVEYLEVETLDEDFQLKAEI